MKYLIDNIIENPEEGFFYHILADWLEDNNLSDASQAFHVLGNQNNEIDRLKTAINYKENTQFVSFLCLNQELAKTIYIPIYFNELVDDKGNSNLIILLRSQGVIVNYFKDAGAARVGQGLRSWRGGEVGASIRDHVIIRFAGSIKNISFAAAINHNGVFAVCDNYDDDKEYYIRNSIINIVKPYIEFTKQLYNHSVIFTWNCLKIKK